MQGVRRLVAWTAAALVLFALIGFGSPAGAAPKPTPTSAPIITPASVRPAAASTSAKPPGLGLSVNLGSVHVKVNLPLDLGGLLGAKPTPSPTSSTPTPSTSAPAPKSTPPTSRRPSVAGPSGNTHAPADDGVNTAYPPTSPHLSTTPPRPPSTHHRPPATHQPTAKVADPRVIFAHGSFPSDGPLALIALCIICGIGVAIVVRLNGGRRRL